MNKPKLKLTFFKTGINMMKQLIPVLLILSLNIAAKSNLSTHDLQLKNSLLWKISGKEITQPSYLLTLRHNTVIQDFKKFLYQGLA